MEWMLMCMCASSLNANQVRHKSRMGDTKLSLYACICFVNNNFLSWLVGFFNLTGFFGRLDCMCVCVCLCVNVKKLYTLYTYGCARYVVSI